MAFDKRALARAATSQVAAGKVRSMFFYATADAAAAVVTAGYFNDARDQLSVGDLIIAQCLIDGSPPDTQLVRVLTVPATGNVTTSANTGAAGA